MTPIREEFEKAFDEWRHDFYLDELIDRRLPNDWEVANWAARWMAERCAVIAEESDGCIIHLHDPDESLCQVACDARGNISQNIRRLSKELE